MKRAIAVFLFIAILMSAQTGVAFAMTEEEVLKAVENNEGKYEVGGPLTRDDFIVFTTDEEIGQYDYDMLVDLKTNHYSAWYPNTQENIEIANDDGPTDFGYTYRGIAIDDRNNEKREVDSSLYSKDTVISRYGIGVSGIFDTKTDELYKNFKSQSSKRKYAEILSKSATWVFYNYKDVGQIKFYFDENDHISYMYFENGIWAEADKETTQTIQEYLNENGYDCGTPDGIAGKKTKAALTQFQEDHDLFPSGYIDDCLMKYLDKQNVNI